MEEDNIALILQFNKPPQFNNQTFKDTLYFKFKLLELKKNFFFTVIVKGFKCMKWKYRF